MAFRKEIFEVMRSGDILRFIELTTPDDALANDGSSGALGTYLHYCAKNNLLAMADHLIKLGANVNFYGGIWKTTPLTYAAERGWVEMVRLLRRHGAEFDVSDHRSDPLHMAIESGHTDMVECLIDEGLDPRITYQTEDGRLINALSCARDTQQFRIYQFLEARGCQLPTIDAQDQERPGLKPLSLLSPVIAYIQQRFGPVDEQGLDELLPVMDGLSVRINFVRPNPNHPYLVLFTSGMSAQVMHVPDGQESWQRAELVMHLPADWPHPRDSRSNESLWPVQVLRQLAYYPHLNRTWFGSVPTIVANEDPPKPLGPGTEQTCLLLVPDFANLNPPLQLPSGEVIHFYTVVPLFTDERDFAISQGMKAFLEQFIAHQVPMIVDTQRKSFQQA